MFREADPTKLRKIRRQVGRRVIVVGRYPCRVSHHAITIEIPPDPRQIYPRIGYRLACGTSSLGMRRASYGHGVMRLCKRCVRASR